MSEFYYYIWGFYVLSALGLLYLSWLMCRNFKRRGLTLSTMALLVAVLFTPAKLVPELQDLTPALMVFLFEGMAVGWMGAWGGLKYILLVYFGLLLLLLLGYFIKMLFGLKSEKKNKS